MISLRNATFTYSFENDEAQIVGEAPGVRDLTVDFPRGSVTVLTGASGSGKSTITRMINGLIPHLTPGDLTGTVAVGGLTATDTPLHELGRLSGTVFQNPRSQFFTTQVADELAFARENAGDEPTIIREAVLDAVQRAGISDWLDRRLDSMSAGELQRVACATVLAGGASIMVLDEPTSNLSPEAIDELRELLAQLKRDGMTIIVAEHRLYFLAELADRVLVLNEGSVRLDASGQEFFAMSDQARRNLGLRTLRPPVLDLHPQANPAGPSDGLTCPSIRFSYGAQPVLDITRAHFPRGQVSAIIGPNGAGKTTLTRVLTGLNANRQNQISLDGTVLKPRELRMRSSMVMQDVHRQLFAPTVAAEVVLGLPDGTATDTADLLDAMDLTGLEERHPMSLSGGQKQRLVIASALAATSQVYVFDEPTSGVDLRHLEEIALRIRGLAAAGAVVLVVTHDHEFIAACADRVYRLGPLEPTGNPIACYSVTHERHAHGA